MGRHGESCLKLPGRLIMKAALVLLLAVVGAMGAPDTRFRCEECVDEMHKLGGLVKYVAEDIQSYLIANYCPTLESLDDQALCEEYLAGYYAGPHGMLFAIVNHFFVDGAVHICQTMGVCDARRYTCEECVEGLEWVEAYMEDPLMVSEYVVYLQQNFCTEDMYFCHQNVETHFPPMHAMAMEKFMIPIEICNTEPVCGADPPTKPPMF